MTKEEINNMENKLLIHLRNITDKKIVIFKEAQLQMNNNNQPKE